MVWVLWSADRRLRLRGWWVPGARERASLSGLVSRTLVSPFGLGAGGVYRTGDLRWSLGVVSSSGSVGVSVVVR